MRDELKMVLNVGLTYNLIREEHINDGPVDTIAELDSIETINALRNAIGSGGCSVTLIEDNDTVFRRLMETRPDIIFNIAEGIHGESRESCIPVVLEMLGIPYTGSGPLTLSMCLNKARTKEILSYYKIPTPHFQVFTDYRDKVDKRLGYPLIVKLLAGGSSMALDSNESIVENESRLRKRVKYLIDTYKGDVIVEEYIEGREFTIPVIGNRSLIVLPIIEVKFMDGQRIVTFEPDEPVVPLIEGVMEGYTLKRNKATSIIPAEIDDGTEQRLKDTAMKAYRALGCRDWCRMEMRMDADGNIFVLELNPIAGIDPSYWFPKSAKAAGIEYNELVLRILDYALERYGMVR